MEGLPGTRPPDVVDLVAGGLGDVVHLSVLPPHKEVQNTVEVAVTHLVGHGGRGEFRGERAPQLLPAPVEGGGAVLPGVQHVPACLVCVREDDINQCGPFTKK